MNIAGGRRAAEERRAKSSKKSKFSFFEILKNKKIKKLEELEKEFNSDIVNYNASAGYLVGSARGNYHPQATRREFIEKNLMNKARTGKLSIEWINKNLEAYRKMAEKADKSDGVSKPLKRMSDEAKSHMDTFLFLKKLSEEAGKAKKPWFKIKRLS